jgi:hypothetical protein
MNKRRVYTIGLTVLLLGVTLTTYGVWTQSSFSHGTPDQDNGCYCHNNGIEVFVNRTGDGNGGVSFSQIMVGSTFHLLVSAWDAYPTGVVPQLQLWESNQTDNAKFTFSPTSVTALSQYNLSPQQGNITALYTITAPTTPGGYVLTLYSQGTLLNEISIQVVSTITSTTTSNQTIPQIATSTDTKPSNSIPGWEYEVLALIALFLGAFISLPFVGSWLLDRRDSKHQEPAGKGSKTRTETASFQHAGNELGGVGYVIKSLDDAAL